MSGSKIGFNLQTANNLGAADKQTPTKTPLQTKVAKTGEYTVERGDTLTEIAAKTGQNLQELLQKNRQIKNPNKIYVGQKIEIGSRSNTYTVKSGDTLSAVAKAKHTTVGDIMRANAGQIGNRNLIYPGQKLRIPNTVNKTAPRSNQTPQIPKTETELPKVENEPSKKPETVQPVNTREVTAAPGKMSPHLKLKSKDVQLSPLVREKMSRIADEYFKKTGKDLLLTDGNRTARDQGERIYDKIQQRGEGIYTNKKALAEIKNAYNEGARRGESREQIVGRMARTIESQAARGVFISRHLTGQGADVRIRDMYAADRKAFLEAAAIGGGARKLDEGDHWHMEVDAGRTLPTQHPQTGGDVSKSQPPRATTEPKTGQLKLGVNEEYRDALLLAQKRTGIDAAAIASVMNAEAARGKSGKWLANSQASTSTARGLTQFLKSTWIERARVEGSYLNEVALQKGFIRKENGKTVVLDENSLLALRDNPTVSILTAAEYGKNNLDLLNRSGLIPQNLSDDQKAKYMYVAHHEGFGGALRYLTESSGASEETAKYVLKQNNTAAGLREKHGSYAEAYKHWAEDTSRRTFPKQIGARTVNAYVEKYGSYEQGYRAWLRDYVNAKIQPEVYRK